MRQKGLILIPAYNEEANLPGVYRELLEVVPDHDILIINDGSGDRTNQVARNLGANVVSLAGNLGYGAALQAGFKYAIRHDYDYVIQFDADGQHDPREIHNLIGCLQQTDADIVIGSRYDQPTSYRPGILRGAGTHFFSWLVRWSTGYSISDPTSGFQLIKKRIYSVYAKEGVYPTEYPDANILILMLLLGVRIEEVPVVMRERLAGKGMHVGIIRNIRYVILMVYSIMISMLKANLFKRKGLHRL